MCASEGVILGLLDPGYLVPRFGIHDGLTSAAHHHPVAGGSWFVGHSCGTREMVVCPSGRYEPSDVRAFRRFLRE